MDVAEKNITWQQTVVKRKDHEKRNGHNGTILWFTGLSGAGKSTLANAVELELHRLGVHTTVLDGDNVRHGLCVDLAFSAEDRTENIRRVGEVAKLFVNAGVIVLTAFISPFRADRDKIRRLVSEGDFIEIYCSCPISVCETRDVKGLYKKARAGVVKDFTGISSPYEIPESPELMLDTAHQSLDQCVEQVLSYLSKKGVLRSA